MNYGNLQLKVPPQAQASDASLKERFSGLYRDIVGAVATAAAIDDFVAACGEQGIVKIRLDPELLDNVVLPNNLHKSGPIDPTHLNRYGQEDRPIHSFLFCGDEGKPGAAYVYSNGDAATETEYASFNGPPHMHLRDAHLGVIMQGLGRFFFLASTPLGKRMVSVPVQRGDLLVIPPQLVHTFWAPQGRPFAVLSMTSHYIPSNTAAFQRVLEPEELTALPPQLAYADFQRLNLRNG